MAEFVQPWQWIGEALALGEPVMLLIVTDSSGSSPGKAGAKMAVSPNRIIGTIGGGAIENGLIQSARESLSSGDTEPKIYRRAHHSSEKGQDSGMICGGEQTVLAYPCRLDDLPLFEQLAECCRRRAPKRLVLSRQGLQLLEPESESYRDGFNPDTDEVYQEVIGRRKSVYIVGGGHVSLMLSKVLSLLDFDIVVIDEREALETMKNNDSAWKKIVIPYAEVDEWIPEGPEVFVIVMTHSHRTDSEVLMKLVEKNVAYLGLLGSRKKVASIREILSRQLPAQHLQKLRAPVGLPIKSHTPAEIAVSIAAELIQVINRDR